VTVIPLILAAAPLGAAKVVVLVVVYELATLALVLPARAVQDDAHPAASPLMKGRGCLAARAAFGTKRWRVEARPPIGPAARASRTA
jgi:hypothetical protein